MGPSNTVATTWAAKSARISKFPLGGIPPKPSIPTKCERRTVGHVLYKCPGTFYMHKLPLPRPPEGLLRCRNSWKVTRFLDFSFVD